MTNEKMEQRLAAAVEKTAPNDVNGVLSRCEERKGTVIPMTAPATIMKLAQEQGALYEIERLTFFKSLETFAHPRSMQIIAEGVETAAELRKVIELGADALQGYFLAKPAAVPAKMAPAARKVIAEYSSASDSG